MRQKLLHCFYVVIFSFALLIPVSTSQAIESDLWHEIARHFSFLGSHTAQKDNITNQVNWYKRHPETLESLVENAKPYLYYIYQQTKERGLPAELALIPIIESNYDPFVHSSAGATGLWQMMRGTAEDHGVEINKWMDGRRDVVASTQAALDHLVYLHEYFGDWLLAIAAYDVGEGKVRSAILANKQHHQATDFWSLPLPEEAKFYIPKLIALAMIVKDPYRFKLPLPSIPNQPFFASFDLHQQVDLNDVAEASGTDLTTIRRLNPAFRHSTTLPAGDYALLIPKDKVKLFLKNKDLLLDSE